MLERARGKIAFVTSLLSFQWGVGAPGHAAGKGGLAGYIGSGNTQALRDGPARSRLILERIPAARWRRPEDIAGAAVFLASSAADSVPPVDGGGLAR
jgi:2-deoxy-D-gluconate 3-dehydrogenase